jgi:hypothetical protein
MALPDAAGLRAPLKGLPTECLRDKTTRNEPIYGGRGADGMAFFTCSWIVYQNRKPRQPKYENKAAAIL